MSRRLARERAAAHGGDTSPGGGVGAASTRIRSTGGARDLRSLPPRKNVMAQTPTLPWSSDVPVVPVIGGALAGGDHRRARRIVHVT